MQCGGCRSVIINGNDNGLLDAHSRPLHTSNKDGELIVVLRAKKFIFVVNDVVDITLFPNYLFFSLVFFYCEFPLWKLEEIPIM